MSLHEYLESRKVSANDPPFYALIMAAFRKADADNRNKLTSAFPVTWTEFKARYNAPGGLMPGETLPEQVKGPPPGAHDSHGLLIFQGKAKRFGSLYGSPWLTLSWDYAVELGLEDAEFGTCFTTDELEGSNENYKVVEVNKNSHLVVKREV